MTESIWAPDALKRRTTTERSVEEGGPEIAGDVSRALSVLE
jgi:hypothetical protein